MFSPIRTRIDRLNDEVDQRFSAYFSEKAKEGHFPDQPGLELWSAGLIPVMNYRVGKGVTNDDLIEVMPGSAKQLLDLSGSTLRVNAV
jgi:hypothetical protein